MDYLSSNSGLNPRETNAILNCKSKSREEGKGDFNKQKDFLLLLSLRYFS